MIKDLDGLDYDKGFLDLLSELTKTPIISREEFGVILRERFRSGIITRVMILDNIIVGTASLIVEPKFTRGGGVVGHIEDVVVLGEYRKRGIAEELIESLITTATLKRCYKVILDCSSENTGYYMRLGFKVTETQMRLDL